ncbi:hypothetical protein J132_10060 [Termitomyces sp. J132]|nr:hypothetical protein H2248_008527 [Termitomyces sp. 'cryptogamus']KNZ81782.1 hypothetical protein J132_10060 [Termitomyces sp. J132]
MFRFRLAGYLSRSRFSNGQLSTFAHESIPRTYCTYKSQAFVPSLCSKTAIAPLVSSHPNSPSQPAHLINQGEELWVGGSDFALEVQVSKLVDKSRLIHEFLHQTHERVTIVLRPRRFGKSMNLSMLKYFFEIINDPVEADRRNECFEKMNIAACRECMKHMGKYPVLLLDLNGFKSADTVALENDLYSRFFWAVLESAEKSCPDVIPQINELWGERFSSSIEGMIKRLMGLIEKSIKKKFIVLIDEYDHPQQYAFEKGFPGGAEDVMKTFYAMLLKTNPHRMQAFCVGILPIAKSSTLSGLNNANLVTMLSRQAAYRDSFGFTKDEVKKLCAGLEELDISPELQLVAGDQPKDRSSLMTNMELCFNGYVIGGGTTIFNPWSIARSISSKIIDRWWVDSASGDMLHEILWYHVDREIIEKCRELLLKGLSQRIQVQIDPNPRIRYASLRENIDPASVWAFLVHAGYLTVDSVRGSDGKFTVANLRIPNHEIFTQWSDWLHKPFRRNTGLAGPDTLMEILHQGDRDRFSALLQNYLQDLSSFDTPKEREDLYHVWMMGISIELKRRNWKVHSNYESGHGRLDLSLQPGDDPKAIILEFKYASTRRSMSAKLDEGFQQIIDNNHCHKLDNHVTSAEIVSICFHNRKARFKFGTAIREGDRWKYFSDSD